MKGLEPEPDLPSPVSPAQEARARHCHTASSPRGKFLNYRSHLTHRQMVICIIYSRLRSLIGHTFADARIETPQSLNESAAHPPRGLFARTALRSRILLRARVAALQPPHFLLVPTPGPQTLRSPLPPQGGPLPGNPASAVDKIPGEGRSSSPRCKATPAPGMISLQRWSRVQMGKSHLVAPLVPLPSLQPSEARNRCRQR